MGNGEVVTRAGEDVDEPEYIVSLYLHADYSQCPTSSMPPWFIKLLQSHGGPYHTLAEAAHTLENPTAYTKVKRCHRQHKRHVELKTDH